MRKTVLCLASCVLLPLLATDTQPAAESDFAVTNVLTVLTPLTALVTAFSIAGLTNEL